MKKLSDLFAGYPSDVLINDIKINSKDVKEGDLFYCVTGVNRNRNDFIDEAIKNGASCIVTNKKINKCVPVVYLKNPDLSFIDICQKFYDFSKTDLKIIATTGTNGKTTVASIIQDLIGNDLCGYIGTNGLKSSSIDMDIVNTTPDASRLYKYFSMLSSYKCKYITMEASSEAFYRKRLNKLKFDIGILTNISEDHLNPVYLTNPNQDERF